MKLIRWIQFRHICSKAQKKMTEYESYNFKWFVKFVTRYQDFLMRYEQYYIYKLGRKN